MCDRVAIIKEGKLIKVERIETLTKNNLKKVRITLDDVETTAINLPGIIEQEKSANELNLLYQGEIRELLTALSTISVKDLLIEEPSLEEVFIHYYEK